MTNEECRRWNESGFSPQCNQITEQPVITPEHTIPEPATYALLGLVMALRRRR